ERDMTVIAAASTGEDALALFDQYKPDVTLMDLNLPGISGLEAVVALRRRDPEARVIVLTMYSGDEDIYRALASVASAYVLKTTMSDELVDIIRQVHAGGRPISSEVAAQLNARAELPSVTPRQREVLQLMTEGIRNRDIAARLGITEDTVEVH